MSSQRAMSGYHLLDRRRFLGDAGLGLSSIALAQLLSDEGLMAAEKPEQPGHGKPLLQPTIDPAKPHASRGSHFPAAASKVLVIFCSGACSHLDTFDYKPELIRQHGKPLPGGKDLITFQGEQGMITQSPWKFRPRENRARWYRTWCRNWGNWQTRCASSIR